MKSQRKSQRGVTLIELVIVLLIVGIIASVAYPSFRDSVRKSRRSDAMAALAMVQQRQEKIRANCRFYAQAMSGVASVCGANAAGTSIVASTTSPDGRYTVALSNASETGYTATATGVGDQGGDNEAGVTCTMVLTVSAANPNGLRTPADCWD